MDASAESARSEGKQPAARPDVHKACSDKTVAAKQLADGPLRFDDLVGAQVARKIEPVIAKPKTAIVPFSVRHCQMMSTLRWPGLHQYDLALVVATLSGRMLSCKWSDRANSKAMIEQAIGRLLVLGAVALV